MLLWMKKSWNRILNKQKKRPANFSAGLLVYLRETQFMKVSDMSGYFCSFVVQIAINSPGNFTIEASVFGFFEQH